MTHICVSKLTVIGSDNGLSPCRRQAIIWSSAGILLIGPIGTNFNEIFIKIHTSSFKKIHLKMSSGKWRPFCLGLNVLKERIAKPCTQIKTYQYRDPHCGDKTILPSSYYHNGNSYTEYCLSHYVGGKASPQRTWITWFVIHLINQLNMKTWYPIETSP